MLIAKKWIRAVVLAGLLVMAGIMEIRAAQAPPADDRVTIESIQTTGPEPPRPPLERHESGFIGVGIASEAQDSKKLRLALGLPGDQKGALVVNVMAGGPAAKAGLKQGDLILKANEKAVTHYDDLTQYIQTLKIGAKVKLTLLRPQEGKEPRRMEVEVQIEQRPTNEQLQADSRRPDREPLSAIRRPNGTRNETVAKPQGPERNLAGVVLGADGKPAAGAEVGLCDDRALFQFVGDPDNNASLDLYKESSQFVKTGTNGEFAFKTQAKYFGLVVKHSSGVTIENEETFPQDGKVRVHPWGRVEGVLKEGNKIVPNHQVQISCDLAQYAPRHAPMTLSNFTDFPRVLYWYTVTTDGQGRFVFDRIHSGPARIGSQVDLKDGTFTFEPMLPIEIKPEGTTVYNLGGMGRAVTGKVGLKEGSAPNYLVTDCQIVLSPLMARPPEAVIKQGKDAYLKWRADWEKTPEGQAYNALKGYYRTLKPEKDGGFRISDLPAGKYLLQIQAYEMRELKLPVGAQGMRRVQGELIGSMSKEFEIPAMKGGRSDEPLDLGKLEILAAKVPKVGEEAPDFKCVTLDGKEMALKDYRGKYVLLDFWATWCGLCREETPALKRVWDEYGKLPNFVMVGLSLDENMDAPEKYIKDNGMGWAQGYLGKWADDKVTKKYGVQGIPAIMLIGPDGKIIEKNLRGERIGAAVEEALKGTKPAKQ